MKIVPQGLRSYLSTAYADAVIALKSAGYVKKAATTKQAPSTEATLARDPSKDAEHQKREVPKEAIAVPNAKDVDEAVAQLARFRGMTSEEVRETSEGQVYSRMQRRDDRNHIGQVELKGYHSRREAAARAFLLAVGTDRPYELLTAEERGRVHNYFSERVQSTIEDWAAAANARRFLDAQKVQDYAKMQEAMDLEKLKV